MKTMEYPEIHIGDKNITELDWKSDNSEGDEDGDISEAKPASKELIDMIGFDPMTIEDD